MSTQATIDKLNKLTARAGASVSALAVADDRAKSAAEDYKAALIDGGKLLGQKIDAKTAAAAFDAEIAKETANAERLARETEAALVELNGILNTTGGDDATE